MAQDARDERQLMRQRGAGTRDVADADFGLDIGAGSRQERQLMRQRGAGNREINNVDFAFAFTTPSTIHGRRSRTRSKTPATATRQSTATRQATTSRTTPVPLLDNRKPSQQPSSARSSRSVRPVDVVRQEGSVQPQRKRRRLSEVSNATRATSVEPPLTTGSKNVSEGLFGRNTSGDEEQSQHNDGSQDQNRQDNIPTSPLFLPRSSLRVDETANKENQTSSTHVSKPAAKKRKRKSISQQNLFKKKRTSGASQSQMPTPSPTQAEELTDPTSGPSTQSVREDRRSSVANSELRRGPASGPSRAMPLNPPQPAISASPTHPPSATQPRPRKKRKSIVKGKTKRRSSGIAMSTPSRIGSDTDNHSRDQGKARDTSDQEERDDLNELSFDFDANSSSLASGDEAPLSAHRRLPTSAKPRRIIAEEVDNENLNQGDNEADETYLPDNATPEPTPAPKRAKQRRQQETARGRRSSSARAKPEGVRKRTRKPTSTFPILIHRTTNIGALPTITEEVEPSDHDVDADELSLNVPATLMTRQNPNAVDVLSQVCTETIESAMTDLKATFSASTSRSGLNRQLTALESFQYTLTGRLFGLSQSLDQRLTMEARVRKVRREKAELQARWLDIRKKRDQLDLRKDAIRRTHWEGDILARGRWEVSQAAHGLEEAIGRDEGGEDPEKQSLEFVLKDTAQAVSSAHGGGVLERLKSFNAQLERLAGASG